GLALHVSGRPFRRSPLAPALRRAAALRAARLAGPRGLRLLFERARSPVRLLQPPRVPRRVQLPPRPGLAPRKQLSHARPGPARLSLRRARLLRLLVLRARSSCVGRAVPADCGRARSHADRPSLRVTALAVVPEEP